MKSLVLLICAPFLLVASQIDIVTFPSQDGVTITAKTYIVHSQENPFIILFHQAGWSHGEYLEIAPKLNEFGYNCMTVDLRSGGEINGIINKTNKNAVELNKPTSYLDAYVDMQSSLKYVIKKYSPKSLIVWGSSYSASLVLKLAAENSKSVDGVIAFSPGEYFTKLGKNDSFIADAVIKLNCPVFITSAKHERESWLNIYKSIPSESKMFFLPEAKGNHGSRSLWNKFKDSKFYWKALQNFLDKYFPINNN